MLGAPSVQITSFYYHVKLTLCPRALQCSALSDTQFLQMGVFHSVICWDPEPRDGRESAKLPSGPDLHPCYAYSSSFRWKVPGSPLLPPNSSPGPRPALGALGNDPFSVSVGASVPAGAASYNVHSSKWIEVTEQMAVTFS